MSHQLVVAGALISGGALLVAQRDRPPHLAGLWELPGGKVAAGERDDAALARELHEELGVEVDVVAQTGGTIEPRDHRALRWVTVDELGAVAWVPADRGWLPDLTAALRTG